MTRYAQSTTVAADKSRAEIEKILARYGADQFLYGWEVGQAVVAFRAHGRQIRFTLPMPDRNDEEFTLTPARRTRRSAEQIEAAYDQAVRQRWRALALVIKAKLEAVETGITEFEDEFMAQIVLPDGQTVGAFMKPQIAIAYDRGHMPKLLPAPGSSSE
ncbi:hypothetical protein [Pelagibius sp.]|uniref:hypothetical protein n=1 Tax=Pelagibius sp. TaxID=1931238 RepID=UPI003BAF419F